MANEQTGVSRLRIGEILLAAQAVTRDQLNRALALQRASGLRVGEALVQLGHLAEPDLQRCLARQLGLPFEPGPDLRLDPGVARLVSEEAAVQHRALPLRLEGQQVLVAMTDPLNFVGLDHVSLSVGRPVRPVVVTEAAFQRAVIRVFGIPEPDGGSPGDGALRYYDVTAAGDTPVVRVVNALIAGAIAAGASDIHIEPWEDRVRVRYRIDGSLVEQTPLPLSLLGAVTARLKVMAGMDVAERRAPQDGQIQASWQGRRVDLRVSSLPILHGERLVLRLLDRSAGVRTLEALGMPPDLEQRYRRIMGRPNGLLLVTGPTGSGKSTTTIATLSALNRPDRNIITIEDPVEYQVPGINQVQVNPRAGLSFARGLRAFLRQDPDIIMLGEIRDTETAEMAMRAALTGHLVLSTLHTNFAAAAPSRLIDMGIEPFLIASSLLAVLAQRLVRLLCQRCREPWAVPADDPVRCLPGMPAGPLQLYRPRGCGFCGHVGYRGQVAIFELLEISGPVRSLIMQRAAAEQIQAAGVQAGMHPLWQRGMELCLEGRTSVEELQRVAFAEV